MSSLIDCSMCQVLAISPLQCHQCGIVFCQECLFNFWNPSPIECIQCSSKNIAALGQVLQQLYEEVLVQRQVQPKEIKQKEVQAPTLAPIDIPEIQANPCHNFLYCRQNINRGFSIEKVCGIECLLFKEINNKHPSQDHQEVRQDIIRALEAIKNRVVNIDLIPIEQTQNQNSPGIQYRGVTKFNFSFAGKSIQIIQEKRQVQQIEEVYVFRTVLGDQGFMNGIHYWEIALMSFTENEIKLGVSQANNFDLNTGFSDLQTGWAYYTIGQLRHGSNSQGNPYGAKIKNQGTIGVLLDMKKGILCFSLDNVFLGLAYQSSELKQGPIYPAVSMLHKAGFTYQVGIPAPAIFNSIYINE